MEGAFKSALPPSAVPRFPARIFTYDICQSIPYVRLWRAALLARSMAGRVPWRAAIRLLADSCVVPGPMTCVARKLL